MYGIFTYIYHILPLKTTIHVGIYTSPMDPMGYPKRTLQVGAFTGHESALHTCRGTLENFFPEPDGRFCWEFFSNQLAPWLFWVVYMVVSNNKGTPKSSILRGFSLINHPFWGTIIFGSTHIYIYMCQGQKSLYME